MEHEAVKTTELRGGGNTLTAQDLAGRAHKLTITGYEVREFDEVDDDGNAYKKKKAILSFHGTDKGMVVNVTNSMAIESMHGDEMDDWFGKQITIQPEMATFKGKQVPAIRVRPEMEQATMPLGGDNGGDAFVAGPEEHFDNQPLGADDPFD